MVLSRIDKIHLSEENESELLNRLEVCSFHEMETANTILRGLETYKNFLIANSFGPKRQLNHYKRQLNALPDQLALKRAAWTKSLADFTTFIQSASLDDFIFYDPPPNASMSNKISSSIELNSQSILESHIINSIHESSETIETWKNTKFERYPHRYASQIKVWEELKERWEKVLYYRRVVLDSSGNDFFWLFG